MPKQQSYRATLSDIFKINSSISDLISNESDPLFGSDSEGKEISRVHNMYHNIINSDGASMISSKPSNMSTYGFLANALTGSRYGKPNKSITGNPKRDEWLNKSRLEKAFTAGDTQMMSYFLSTNSDIIHIYDEIDSICAYIYQLEEAIDMIRDNVLSSDIPGTMVNYDVVFPGISADDAATYKETIKEAFTYQQLNKKLSTIAIPKLLKYGTYYFIVIPYSEIGPKLSEIRGQHGSVVTFESTIISDKIMPNIKSLYEAMEYTDRKDNKSKKDLSDYAKSCLKNIEENLSKIEIDESEGSFPNVFGDVVLENFSDMSEDVKKAAKKALSQISKKSTKTSNNVSDGVIDPKQFDNVEGCYIQVCDPRQLRPVKIFDYVIGYYYLENFNYEEMGTSITDLLSNQMNFNEQNMIIDNLVDSVLSQLKYGDVLKGDQQFRTMILNCVLYAERRNSPIRIKFISPDYVIPFTTNEDQNGNGQPILLRSLFYGRLYTSLLLFNITAIITKSTDTEFYWLKQGGLDQQYSNQVTDLIDQMKASNVDPLDIANGNILRGNSAINKRYYMNAGVSGERPFDMEVVSGQQVDIHNDLLTDLRKMTIGASSVPAAAIDVMDEVEYATQLHMMNIKHLKRCNNIQTDIDPSLTNLIRTVCRHNFPSAIPEAVLSTMEIHLKRSKVIESNLTTQQFSDMKNLATDMVDTYNANSDTNPPEIDSFIKDNMIKELTMELTSSAPWDLLPEIKERAIIQARKQEFEQKALTKESES